MQSLPAALSPLEAWPQFVAWKALPSLKKPGKMDKFPLDWNSGAIVSAHDPRYWTNAPTALVVAPRYDQGHGSGAGFVLTDDDPFFFLDIDNALDLATNQWSPLAQALCARFAGAAIEVSHSGRGLHIFGRTSSRFEHGTRNIPLGLELYTSKRFAALTGLNAIGSAATDCTAALAQTVYEYFPPNASAVMGEWSLEPVPEYTGPEDDDELIRMALASVPKSAAAAFGAAEEVTFAHLWNADADVLSKRWPDATQPYNASSADQALANMLAFWTGKNCERMQTLMWRSQLVRDKWTQHRTYLGLTIQKAVALVQNVYSKARGPTVPFEVQQAAAEALGASVRDPTKEYLPAYDQLEHFKGCVYVHETERIFCTERNTEFKRTSFDVEFGGHVFMLDGGGAKTTTSAWEAFTLSRVNAPRKVYGMRFLPEIAPGSLFHESGRAYVNAYLPREPLRIKGDVTPFLTHLTKLLPDPNDRQIILSYMAAIAQNPGKKFQWWPVIQGAEGNGKTLLMDVLVYLVGREYAFKPNSHAMSQPGGTKFNSWIYRKLFIGIEEIALSNRRDFLDEFKTFVTNRDLPVERKGVDQVMTDNRANGMMATNHRDGVPITADTRRYAIFYCAQQEGEPWKQTHGMGPQYFAMLHDWFRGEGDYATFGANYGFAITADYLHGLQIADELNPAKLCTVAPRTSSTLDAIQASLGRAEQEVLEAVAEGRVGFNRGWVSSYHLDLLLDRVKAGVPRNKRKTMLKALGYVPHPALPEGRSNSALVKDGNSKSRLYVKEGHLALNIESPAEVGKAYEKAQEPGADEPSAAQLAFAPANA